MSSITLVNQTNQALVVDQWTIPAGKQQPVPAVSPNMIAAKNAGQLQIVVQNDGLDNSRLFNAYGDNTLLPTEMIASGYGAIAFQAKGTLNFDASQGNGYVITLTGNITHVNKPANLTPGQKLTLEFKQDATGSRTLPSKANWDAAYTFVGGTAPTLSTAANAVDIIEAWYDGTKIRVDAVKLAYA